MREGHPAAAGLFREHAGHYGLTLTDPAAPLGSPARCRRELRAAGFVPTATVTETVRFSRIDLDHAWQAHTQGAHHDTIAALSPGQREAFRAGYTSTLAELLSTDEDRVLDAKVIYAFGRADEPGTDA